MAVIGKDGKIAKDESEYMYFKELDDANKWWVENHGDYPIGKFRVDIDRRKENYHGCDGNHDGGKPEKDPEASVPQTENLGQKLGDILGDI